MMNITITTDPNGTYPTVDELHRLAERARERGVSITGSPSRPQAFEPDTGRTFDLTALSCSCRMFVVGGGCQHFALFSTTITNRPTAPPVYRMRDGTDLDLAEFTRAA